MPAQELLGVDKFVIFSDRRPRFLYGWEWRQIPDTIRGLDQTRINRFCKFFPHKLFDNFDVSVYIDGNILLKSDISKLVQEFIESDADIGLFKHSCRNNIEEEYKFSFDNGKIKENEKTLAAEQMSKYRAYKSAYDAELTENAIIFRRHDRVRIQTAMALWWEEIERYCKRDQLSLPYALAESGAKKFVWPWNFRNDNPFFYRYPHRVGDLRDVYTFIGNVAQGPSWISGVARLMVRGVRWSRRGLGKAAR